MLNKDLYDRLSKIASGGVLVVNENEPYVYNVNALTGYIEREESGEQYRMNCPFCGDSRRRLYINHRYGTIEPITNAPLWHIAKCLNENCDTSWLRVEVLGGKVFKHTAVVNAIVPRQKEIETPGVVQPLTGIQDQEHAALAYLRERGINPYWLAANFNVGYCLRSKRNIVKDRLVFSLSNKAGEYFGFQARAIHKRDKGPKWYTGKGSKVSHIAYGLDRAAETDICVIVEGILDMPSCGAHGVCTFGKSISPKQVNQISEAFRYKGTVIIAYDPDAHVPEKSNKISAVGKAYSKLDGHVNKLEVAVLPGKSDPGDLKFAGMHELIKTQFGLELRA